MSNWAFWPTILNVLGFGGPRVAEGVQPAIPGAHIAPLPVNVDFERAMQVSAWWACVRLLTETCATLPLKMYRTDGDASVEVKDHPVINLLRFKPNKYQTRIEFFEVMFLNLVVHGNAYARIMRNGAGDVVALLPIMAQQMQVELVSGDVIYRWSDGANAAYYAQDSILHWKLFGNGIIGMSPLAYAASTIGIGIAEQRAVSNIYRKGFRPAGVLHVDAKLDKEQRKVIRDSFADLVEDGEGNELVVLDRFMKYTQTSMTPQDSQFLESRRFSVQDIARFMGVNSVLINDGSQTTSWGSGIEQLMDGAYKLTFRPLLERAELAMLCALVKLEERPVYEFEFDFDAVGRMNILQRAQAFREQIHSAQRTPNEARLAEGLKPLPGGDTLFIQSASVPINQARAQP